jgi:excisionase family DNA binding protein
MPDLTIAEAAARLGVSKEALRSRVQRRRIDAYKDADGQWRVVLPETETPALDDADASGSPRADAAGASGSAAPPDAAREDGSDATGMVALLKDQLAAKDAQIATLHQQLTDRSREVAELHRMLNLEQQSVSRLLPASTTSDAPESPVRDYDDTMPSSPASSAKASPDGSQRVPEASATLRGWFARRFGTGR